MSNIIKKVLLNEQGRNLNQVKANALESVAFDPWATK
ncbi:MAG: hypothetical protein RL094_690 [Candidatus Parcubacteria bacterium]|jgi:hypothetical protein